MDRDNGAPLIEEQEWEPPTFEEVRVSAEATAYMGIQDDWT
jgi:coenzyme PQQ precursor peptide PqqA